MGAERRAGAAPVDPEAWATEDNGADRVAAGSEPFADPLVKGMFEDVSGGVAEAGDGAGAGPGLDELARWPAAAVRARAGEVAAALAGRAPDLAVTLGCWHLFGSLDAPDAFAALGGAGMDLARRQGISAGAPAAAEATALAAALAATAVQAAGVRALVGHPPAARVLDRLRRADPVAYKELRRKLCAGTDWTAGARDLDRVVREGAAEVGAVVEAARRQCEAPADASSPTPGDEHVPVLWGDFVATAGEVERAFNAEPADPSRRPVFAHGRRTAVVARAVPTTVQAVVRGRRGPHPPAVVVEALDADSLRERLRRSVRLEAWRKAGDGREVLIEIVAPGLLLATLLAQRGRGLRPLTGIAEAPLVDLDGTVLDHPGYDTRTGLFLALGGCEALVPPADPTPEDARAAYRYLVDEASAEFDFASLLDAAAAVAMLLTALERRLLPAAPGFVVTAPTQSSGKTALCGLVCRCALGRPLAVRAWPGGDEAEMQKSLIAMLREGLPAVLFDNLKDGSTVDSAEIAKLVTGESYGGRLLGGNVEVDLPANILLLFTGNNLQASRDFATRLVEVRLEPATDRPSERRYGRDIEDWAAEHRPAVVRAALMLVRSHLVATTAAERRERRRTRFPAWDEAVRQAIVWANDGDPAVDLANRTARAIADAEEQDDAPALLDALLARYGETSFTARGVAEACGRDLAFPVPARAADAVTDADTAADADDAEVAADRRLATALKPLLGPGFGAKALAARLRSEALGRVVRAGGGRWKLGRREDPHTKVMAYRFEALGDGD